MTNRRCERWLGFAEFLTLRGRPFSRQHPPVSFTCLLLMSWFNATCLAKEFALGGSSLRFWRLSFKIPFFFSFFAGPASVLRFYTESAGSPWEQSVITLTQKPQPDHQSAATTAAAAMVRNEISFEGMIFTWYDGADTRCSSGDKKCVRLLSRTLITFSWVVGL